MTPYWEDDCGEIYHGHALEVLQGMESESVTNGKLKHGQTYPKRNKRTVWTVATHPFSAAHFATFPPKLIEPCILAGTSEKGACAECGAPWERVGFIPDNITTEIPAIGL